MKTETVLRQSLLVGVIAVALTGCMASSDELSFVGEEEMTFQQYSETDNDDFQYDFQNPTEDDFIVGSLVEEDTFLNPEEEEVCKDDCIVSEDYLTTQFVQETEGDVVALSRPAGMNAVSVKDKVEEKQVQTVQKKTEPKLEEKVLYTTVSIPEVVEGEERLVSENTKETVVAVIQKNEEKTAETDSENETGFISETAMTDSTGMIPLKKVKTTITETTTKVEQETPRTEWKKDMTLAERIAYGQEEQEWSAENGKTLRQLLLDWGNKAGWTVVWKLDRDYNLEAGVIFTGTFTDVSSALIRSFARATPAPIGTFYQGNRVLVINTQEDENER